MENLGIVSLYLRSKCLSVAGTRDPLTQCLVRLPLTKSSNRRSVDVVGLVEYSGLRIPPLDATTFPRF
jgi:hypothetical protein